MKKFNIQNKPSLRVETPPEMRADYSDRDLYPL